MRGEWSGGKGSTRRIGSNQKLYEEGWERIFGKNKKEKDVEKEHLDEKKEDFDRQ